MAVYYTVEQEISLGRAVSVTYKPSLPSPSQPDGHFGTKVLILTCGLES